MYMYNQLIIKYFTIRQAALNDDIIDPSIMNKETQPVVKEMSENSLPFGFRKTGNYLLIHVHKLGLAISEDAKQTLLEFKSNGHALTS